MWVLQKVFIRICSMDVDPPFPSSPRFSLKWWHFVCRWRVLWVRSSLFATAIAPHSSEECRTFRWRNLFGWNHRFFQLNTQRETVKHPLLWLCAFCAGEMVMDSVIVLQAYQELVLCDKLFDSSVPLHWPDAPANFFTGSLFLHYHAFVHVPIMAATSHRVTNR